MFLRRVTVTGFKSFAGKTVLDLEPGVTAVVGPNGSGKSNLADAVRWALGEQSKGRLRLGDREEVVFAGSDKRARASFAEVVLLFNNEDGAFPLDLTEVEVSRRLYRSGETDYRLAGRSVRLSDIQALMAQAGFGVGSYAVIGQGMIDSFLLSSPAERKLLFDEAVGIRGPELGREAALRKLRSTSTNLTRLRDITAELAPRLATLQSAASAADVQQELEGKVSALRIMLAAGKVAHWKQTSEALTGRLATMSADAKRLGTEAAGLERRLAAEQAKDAALRLKRDRLQRSLTDLEHERDRLGMELATSRGAITAADRAAARAREVAAQVAAARAELTAAHARRTELEAELATNTASADRALQAVERAGRGVAEAQAALVAVRRSATDSSRDQYVDHALQILRTVATDLSEKEVKLEQVRLLVHKAGRLLSHAGKAGSAELLAQLKTAQKQLENAMAKRETAVEHQTNITITRRSLEIDLAHQQQAVDRAETALSELEASLGPATAAAADLAALQAAAARTAAAVEQAASRLERQREQVHALNASADSVRAQADLAAAAERAKTAAAAAEAQQTGLQQDVAAASAELTAARSQARAQHVPADAPVPTVPLEDVELQLVRAEAALEAHVAARRDQTTEYETVDARHTELVAQIADLEAAGANLEQVVVELDVRIRERFKTNFARLAGQFSHYFTRLFSGGTASLELVEDEESGYGISVKVSPRGKRQTSLAALSGGERALAGVALLAAILRTNPSPFVVLDEIDAALDEANSTRLAAILAELQEHTQLIVITHNRQTMHAARVLFGVTMNEHHVSQLLSMRLEEATQLAAR